MIFVPSLFKSSYRLIGITLGLLFWFALLATSVLAADVVMAPSSGTYSANQTFTVNIQADPKGDSINAVEAKIKFDQTKLSVVSISKAGSAFSLWTTEPAFNNTAGTIDFGGGSPAPFSAKSTLLSVTFRALAEGSAAVSFTSASALAADGLGTDVLDASPGGTYTIAAGAPTPPPTPPPPPPTPTEETDNEESTDAAIAFGDPPRSPEVGSPNFIDPELWYKSVDGLFTWELPFDVNAVAVEIATSSDNDPTTIFKPPIDELVVSRKNLIDGIQYLSIKYQNQVGWGTVTNRIVKIDTIPPEPFTIAVKASNSKTGFPMLVFEATDSISGISHYDLFIADREPVQVTAEESKLGYLLGELEDGTYTIKVIAYDLAGNTTESSVPVLITAGWVKASDVAEGGGFWSWFTPLNAFIIFLIAMVIFLLAYIFYERKQHSKTEEKLRKETREIQDQMEKIFSALRDEIYDQINAITRRPRLSKNERDAVEGLNQALEVSETLIEKEINDVKKILK